MGVFAKVITCISLGILLVNAGGAFGQDLSDRIDGLFSAYNRPGVPGAAVAVFQNGEVLFQRGYGAARLKNSDRVTGLTNFRLASLTKQFTAMAVMMLKEDGKLAYDRPITDYLTGFPEYARTITVRHILNHTSGLRDYEELIPPGMSRQLHDKDVVDILRRQNSTYFKPGSQYRYSNSGYATLAHLVSEVSGQSFASFLKERIFSVLDMGATVAFEDGISSVEQRAYGHTLTSGEYAETDQSQTSAVLGDGGVYTSLVDYFKWDQTLYTDQLVSSATLAEAFTPGHLSSGATTGYGFGWQLDTYRGYKRVGHTGSTIGFRSAVTRIPKLGLTVIVLVNRANATPWETARQILDLVLDQK